MPARRLNEFEQYIRDQVVARGAGCLYKFRTVESGLRIINDRKLYFGSPLGFNDPFDCQLTVNTSGTLADVTKHLNKVSPERPRAERRRMGKAMLKDPAATYHRVNKALREVMEETGISCFCRTWEPILIWSYYANDHKGIVLGFDPSMDQLFEHRVKVRYESEYPSEKYWTRKLDMMLHIITTKYKLWEHEQEVRVIHDSPGAKEYRPEALREVIFGCRCEDQKLVMDACSAKGLSHVKFYQAKKIPFKFALERIEIVQS